MSLVLSYFNLGLLGSLLPAGFDANRGVFCGGVVATSFMKTWMQMVSINILSNSRKIGDLTVARLGAGAGNSFTRGIICAGSASSFFNVIDYFTIAIDNNAIDFGDHVSTPTLLAGCSSDVRAVFAGGLIAFDQEQSRMDYVTIDTTSNTTFFGQMTEQRAGPASANSATRGFFVGGTNSALHKSMDFITIDTTGTATDFGDLSIANIELSGLNSDVRACFGGGRNIPFNDGTEVIDYITMSTLGNTIDFGDLTKERWGMATANNLTRGLWAGGEGDINGNDRFDIIDYVTINTLGNALDFGDLGLGVISRFPGVSGN